MLEIVPYQESRVNPFDAWPFNKFKFTEWGSKNFEKIQQFSSQFMEGHHDFPHYKRVWRFGSFLQHHEGGDPDIVLASIWMHDIGRKLNTAEHASIGAEIARLYLPTVDFPLEKVEAVARAILIHDDHGAQKTIEEMVVYDADRLDCFTWSGVMRCFLELQKGRDSTFSDCIKGTRKYLDTAYKHLNTCYGRGLATMYKAEYLDNLLSRLEAEQEI
jgi:hypothetical protein